MYKYFRAKEKLKKVFNYFSIFTIIFGTTFGSINSASANAVTINGTPATAFTDADIITLTDDETIVLAADDQAVSITTTEGADATLDISAGTLTLTGDITTAATSTLDITIDASDGLAVAGAVTESDATTGAITFVIEGSATLTFNGSAAKTIAAKVNGITADGTGGTLAIGGTATKTFSDSIGATYTPSDLTVASGAIATFSSTVDVEDISDNSGTLTLNGVSKIDTITNSGTLNLNNTLTETDGTAASSIAMTGTSSDLNLKAQSTKTLTTAITAATDGDGRIDIIDGSGGAAASKQTITGAVGTTASRIGTIVVGDGADNGNVEFDLNVFADSLTVKAGGDASEVSLATFDGDLTVTNGITLDDTSAVISSKIVITGTKTLTGTVDGAAAGEGNIQITGDATVASAIGGTNRINTLDSDEDIDYNAAITATSSDFIASKTASISGAIDISQDTVLNGKLDLDGSSAFSVTAYIEEGGGAGNIDVTNTSTGGVTFVNALGTDYNSGTTQADAIDLFAISNSGSRAVMKAADNNVDQVDLAAGAILEIDRTITNGQVVFADAADTVVGDMPTTAKIYMPSNLKDGQAIYLLSDVGTPGVMADNLDTAIQDNVLYTYDASLVDAVDTSGSADDIKITASKRTATAIASQISTTTNDATGFYEASRAAADGVSNDTAAVDAMSDVLNGSSGYSTADAKSLALQVAPQDDMISGSTVATRAMTGTVQGIMSSRMASLRSGDAYFGTGMSAGAMMSANSGFIQAFGTEAEQKNKTVGSGTQYGYDSNSSGIAIGFDGINDNGAVVGLSLSMSSTDVDGKGTGKAKNDIDSYTASIYMDKATDSGYIEGSLTVGLNENNSSRLVNTAGLSRTYKGSYDSQQVSLKIGGGVPNSVGNNGYVTPFGSITGTIIKTDAYTETSTTSSDSLRLRVAQDDVSSVVGTLGVKYHNVLSNGGVPMISLAINNEFGDDTINSTNTYQGGGTSFTTSTAVEELSATLGLGFSMGNDVSSVEFAYEANVNDDDYLGHYGSFKIVTKF